MHVKGWVKSSLLDFPGQIAASLFCGGCNFRCPNCHNSHLVLHPNDIPDIPEPKIWSFLENRRGLLDGVVISGGEPTLQPDLVAFAFRLREMGFLVKLDTNGYRPDALRAMMQAGVVDYVAMDLKAPLLSKRYSQAAGVQVDVVRIRRSIDLLRQGRVNHEFRTTLVPGLVEEDDILQIAKEIAGASCYYLQQFVARNTLDPGMVDRAPYLPEKVRSMLDLARQWVERVEIRGA